MRYFTAIAILSSLAAFVSASAVTPDAPALDNIEERSADSSPLDDRAIALTKCPDGNGCKCDKVKQDQVSAYLPHIHKTCGSV
jgi:hypothetical protein